MIRPYNLLVSYSPLVSVEKLLFVNTAGDVFDSSEVDNLNVEAYTILDDSEMADHDGAVSDYFYPRMNTYMASKSVKQELMEAFNHYLEREEGIENASDSLEDLGRRGYSEYKTAEGDQNQKWKSGGYKTLFDFILGYWTADIKGLDPVLGEERMLCAWLAGQACRSMEALSEDEVVDGIMELLDKTLGKRFNISWPQSMVRSRWWSNPLTLGTYSFRTVVSDRLNLSNSDLAQPVLDRHNKPVLLFAGEATHNYYFSTIHGALESGLREAHNLITYVNSQS